MPRLRVPRPREAEEQPGPGRGRLFSAEAIRSALLVSLLLSHVTCTAGLAENGGDNGDWVAPPPRIYPPASTTLTPNGTSTYHTNMPVYWTVTPLRGNADYTIVEETTNSLTLQAGREGGMYLLTATVIQCISGACLHQLNSAACVSVATGARLTDGNCNEAYATATWGIVTRIEVILVTLVLAAGFLSCLICLNGTEVVPGVWAKDREIWATFWSHENPNLKRAPVIEPQGDGMDRRQPEVKPRMYRSFMQQQTAQL